MRNVSFWMGDSRLINNSRNMGQRIMTEISLLTYINKQNSGTASPSLTASVMGNGYMAAFTLKWEHRYLFSSVQDLYVLKSLKSIPCCLPEILTSGFLFL